MRVLVRGPNWVGDLVMATPGFRALRARLPDAHIALHLRPGLEALVDGAPWFDEIMPVASYHRGSTALLREAARLRECRFDLGICLPDSISSALLMRLAGVRQVVGYRRAGRGVLLHRAVSTPPEWGRRRMVARERFVLGLVASLGCGECGTELELHTTASERERVDRLLEPHSAAPDRPLAVMAPGASYGASKRWGAESFARVGDALARKGLRVVVSGSREERGLTASVSARMEEPALDLAANLDLGAFKALVARASLVLCNDAGARHLAAAFRIPCVVLMGPTSLEKTNLNLEGIRVLEADANCRPCYLRECPIDHRCMTRIGVQDVIASALAALEEASGTPVVV